MNKSHGRLAANRSLSYSSSKSTRQLIASSFIQSRSWKFYPNEFILSASHVAFARSGKETMESQRNFWRVSQFYKTVEWGTSSRLSGKVFRCDETRSTKNVSIHAGKLYRMEEKH